MSKKDMASKIVADAAIVSGTSIVDTAGAESLTFILNVAAGTTVALQEGDDSGLSDAADVPEEFIIVADDNATVSGNDVTFAAAGTGVIGVVGSKRYVQPTVGTPAADATIVAVLGDLLKAPAE